MDVLPEVVHPEGTGETRRPIGGQHVIGTGQVVAHAGRRVRAEEHGPGRRHLGQQRFGVAGEDLEVLRRHDVGDGQRLLRTVHQHGEAADAQVISQAMPSGPCSACTTRSMAAHSVGVSGPAITTTSDGPAKAEATPTTPETWRLASATWRLPGPTMTSTGSMDWVP